MKFLLVYLSLLLSSHVFALPSFTVGSPIVGGRYTSNSAALCATAKQTLAYLNRVADFDPQVIHEGSVTPVSLQQVKDTLAFICQHQTMLNNPEFIKQHFDFIRWQPDVAQARHLAINKPLLKNLPNDR